MGDTQVLRALANPTPYPGAPASPVAATPGAASPDAQPMGPPPEDPNGVGDLCRRAQDLKTQADTLSKQLGYLLSDATLHDAIPGRIETKLQKALNSLGDSVSMIDDVCEDMGTLGDDDDEEEDDDEDEDD